MLDITFLKLLILIPCFLGLQGSGEISRAVWVSHYYPVLLDQMVSVRSNSTKPEATHSTASHKALTGHSLACSLLSPVSSWTPRRDSQAVRKLGTGKSFTIGIQHTKYMGCAELLA